jgi:hypothetical protein
VKAIFTTALIGTRKINAEMLAAMSLVFFTLINVLAYQTVGHETISREARTHWTTIYTFTQLGATSIVLFTWKFLSALLPAI